MTEPTETQVVPSPVMLAGLTQLLAVGGPFHTTNLHLMKSNVTFGKNTTLADVTEADYSGYAAITGQTFSTPFYDVDGTALAIGADAPFIATAATPFVGNVIYGYYLTDTGNTNLEAGFNFATPVGITKAGDACPVVPFLRYSGT